MWVAREKSGRLFLFTNKPIRHEKCPGLWVNDNVITPIMEIDSSLFPNLKWEDDPIEVTMIPKDFITELDKFTANICSSLLGRPNIEATPGDVLVSMRNAIILLNNYVGSKR